MSLEQAQAYLARGWSIVPGHTPAAGGLCSCRNAECTDVGKHPRIKWKEYQDRLPTPAEVKYWWTRWPDANYCLLTGRVSNVGAIDVDPRHGGDEAWREWCAEHGPLPITPVSLTGGGGQHVFFVPPANTELRRAIGVLPGVDWMGDGGYLVLPGSHHVSGRTYEWDTEFHIEDMPLAPMPPSLVLMVLRRAASKGATGEPGERRPPVNGEAYMAGKIKIEEGERNEQLTRVSGYFAEMARSPGELFFLMDDINQKCCSSPLADSELKKITDSIWGREHNKDASTAPGIASVDLTALAVSDAPKIDIASILWGTVGLPVVTDWYQLQGDKTEYVLVTPEDELRFVDLLRYEEDVRGLLLNRLGVLAPRIAKGERWRYDQWAQAVRNCAREVLAEPRTAEERIVDWVNAYTVKTGTRIVEVGKELEALRSGPVFVDGRLTVNLNHFAMFIETTFGEQMKVLDLRHLLRRAGWQPDGKLRAYTRPEAVAAVENERMAV